MRRAGRATIGATIGAAVKRLAVAAAAILVTGAPLYSQTLSPADKALIHRVDAHYNHLHSLRAAYTERYSGMGMERTETGILLLKKPGRMRWDYANPAGKVFLLDGKYGWFYTPGDAQAQRIPARQLDDLRSPLRLLLGHTELEKELDSLAIAPHGEAFEITGIPKGMAARVRLLTLVVSSQGQIERIELEELGGATTEFLFRDIQEDLPIPDSEFHFTPPAGITVVDGLPPI